MIELREVVCHKHTEGEPHAVLDGVSLHIRPGEMVCLIGRSGSGKSTLLRTIVALEAISAGAILIEGKNILQWDIQALRRTAGLVLQSPSLFSGTVEENVLYGPRINGQANLLDGRLVAACLEQAGLPPKLANRPADALSLGQQMRVSLARTLANQPKALLLDEPTGALDPETGGQILQNIQQLQQHGGMTILMVTHDHQSAFAMNGRVLEIEAGKVREVRQETPDTR